MKKTIPIRCNTPGILNVSKLSKKGKYGRKAFKKSPNNMSFKLRVTIFLNIPNPMLFSLYTNAIDIPIMYRKKGNTRSANVNPFHVACNNGAYT